uniref:patatin-like phospholipase family protein n=1 Tax=Microbulbifer agarilyticus TaxID=260552 RepID=UPI001110608B|nr:patatin-like phospholipase family protein [Microbulbifer agarilyticus]
MTRWEAGRNAEIERRMSAERSPELAVLLAFSGGGTRASALAYGVLEELRDTPVHIHGRERSLLQEVDVISSVSGGSFTAAYYGLYGNRIFEDFEQRFLRADVQSALLSRTLNPRNWPRLASRTFGRSDLAAEYYDQQLFGGATLAHMEWPGAPRVVINASDLSSGVRIPFLRELFDLYCIDVGAYPISRAVAASSSVPLLFSPIAVKNHAGTCGFPVPEELLDTQRQERQSKQALAARELSLHLDRERWPWFHLVDGAISDNLGLRSFYRNLSLRESGQQATDLMPQIKARHILVILVDASARPHVEWARHGKSPPLFQVAKSVVNRQISHRSDDTILLTREKFEDYVAENSTPERPVTFHFAEINFEHLPNPAERAYFDDIGTNFRLTDQQVDQLIAVSRHLLTESDEFRGFLQQLGAQSTSRQSRSP